VRKGRAPALSVTPGTRLGSCCKLLIRRRVIAFDRPPFGLSGRPLAWESEDDNPYTSQAGARFCRGLLTHLGVGRAVVCGHSAGAGVAVEMALR